MKMYIKKINNISVVKRKSEISVVKDGMQIINPSEELLLENGWEEHIVPEIPEPTPEELLQQSKYLKEDDVLTYDASPAVNQFYINEMPMWLDKATRAGLMLRFQAEQASGKTETILWHEGMQFPLTLDIAFQMLYALEIYASECYDNTQKHLGIVSNLSTIEEVESYDYTTGYPDKLRF